MTFPTGKLRNNSAFTLIELIVTMALMVIVIGVVAPSLRGFFHGRNLEGEADQFVTLTRYGRSRAIAEGLPVELWIDPNRSTYGLAAMGGYSETMTNPIVYSLDKSVKISSSPPPSLSTITHSNYWTPTANQNNGQIKIRFQPDGFISETSPQFIYLQQPDSKSQIAIAEDSAHLKYAITNR